MEHDSPVILTQTISSSAAEWRLPVEQGVPLHFFDHFVQLSTDFNTQSYVVRALESDEFMSGLVRWADEKAHEVDLLKSFAAWQKSKLDYNALHTAWLLEAMTLDEFVEEAANFAVELSDQDPLHVAQVAEKLTQLLPFDLSTSELAEFLHTEPRAVLNSIAMFCQHSDKLRALLPDDKRQLPTD